MISDGTPYSRIAQHRHPANMSSFPMKKLINLQWITGCLCLSAMPITSAQDAVAENQQPAVTAPGAQLKQLGSGFDFTEGPSADRQGNVFFTDQPNDRIVRWDAEDGSFSDWLKPAGRSNGTFFDKDGNLWACADGRNELWSITPDKEHTVILNQYDNKLMNGPNDLWIRPDGGIYFTDPLYPRNYWERDPAMQQDGQHLYFLQKGAVKPVRVADDFKQPNGLIGTPDGKTLYVADIGGRKTYAFDIQEDGNVINKRLFCELGSDGMTIDNEGNVYLTGRGVTVYNPEGEKIQHIPVPGGWTANVTFGGKNNDLLFITASKSVYGIQMRTKGVSPF